MLISFAAARLEVASCISSSSSGVFKDNSSLVFSQQKLTGFGILRQTKNVTDWGLARCARFQYWNLQYIGTTTIKSVDWLTEVYCIPNNHSSNISQKWCSSWSILIYLRDIQIYLFPTYIKSITWIQKVHSIIFSNNNPSSKLRQN